MSELDDIIEKYLDFERNVRVMMDSVCARHCSCCDNVCCKQDFCRETVESPFLAYILKTYPPAITYSNESGWLTDSGCGLLIGRPPVCYEFLCDRILASQRSDIDAYMVKILSALMTHIGKKAAGGRHLVEILDRDDLYRIQSARFEKKLQEARAALGIIAAYFDKKKSENHGLAILGKIMPNPG